MLAHLHETFPDFQISVVEVLVDGNKVVVRSEITGTQRGVFMGRPATDRQLRMGAIDVHEVVGGKIVRTWHMEDWMTGFRQLGLLDG
ncbi:ester cyclase [Sorangium sp. So ce1128]